MSGQTVIEAGTGAADRLVGQIEEELAAAKDLLRRMDVARGEQAKVIRRLEEARAKLVGRKPRVKRAGGKAKTAMQRAGRGNVEAVTALLRERGPLAKAAITETLAKNDGTVTYALRAAEEAGAVRATDRRERGSVVYEHVGALSAVTRPGD